MTVEGSPDRYVQGLGRSLRLVAGDLRMVGGFTDPTAGTIEIDGDEIRISPSGVTSKTGSEATPWLTRKGDKVELTMDGPHVFKGRPLERKGSKQYV